MITQITQPLVYFKNQNLFNNKKSLLNGNGAATEQLVLIGGEGSKAGKIFAFNKYFGGASLLSELDDISVSGLTEGQVLKWNGSKWTNGTDNTSTGGGGSAVTCTTNKNNITVNTSGIYTIGTITVDGTTYELKGVNTTTGGSNVTWASGDNITNSTSGVYTIGTFTIDNTPITLKGVNSVYDDNWINTKFTQIQNKFTNDLSTLENSIPGELNDLLDVEIFDPSDGDRLKYDSAKMKWVNYTPTSGDDPQDPTPPTTTYKIVRLSLTDFNNRLAAGTLENNVLYLVYDDRATIDGETNPNYEKLIFMYFNGKYIYMAGSDTLTPQKDWTSDINSLSDRIGTLQEALASLQQELQGFKDDEFDKVLDDLNDAIEDLQGFKARLEAEELQLGLIFHDDMTWDESMKQYLQQAGLIELVDPENPSLGYKATYTKLIQSIDKIEAAARQIDELMEEYEDPETHETRYRLKGYDEISAQLTVATNAANDAASLANAAKNIADANASEIESVKTSVASLRTYASNSGIDDEGKALIIDEVASGFESDAQQITLKDGTKLYNALASVFALSGTDDNENLTKEELLAYIRAKVNSDKKLASAALVSDAVSYEVEMERATDETHGNLWIDSEGTVYYKDGSTFKKLEDDSEKIISETPIEYMVPQRTSYGALVYKQAKDENNNLLWCGDNDQQYHTANKNVDTLVYNSEDQSVAVLKYGTGYVTNPTSNTESKYYIEIIDENTYSLIKVVLEPKKIVKKHQWAGVITESTLDKSMASLFAQNTQSEALAAFTATVEGDDAFIDAVAAKTGEGIAEATFGAVMKQITGEEDGEIDGAYIIAKINEDNSSQMLINADHIDINGSNVVIDADRLNLSGVLNQIATNGESISQLISDGNSISSRVSSVEDGYVRTSNINQTADTISLTVVSVDSNGTETTKPVNGITINGSTGNISIEGQYVNLSADQINLSTGDLNTIANNVSTKADFVNTVAGKVTFTTSQLEDIANKVELDNNGLTIVANNLKTDSNFVDTVADAVQITADDITIGAKTLSETLVTINGDISAVDAKFDNVTAKKVDTASDGYRVLIENGTITGTYGEDILYKFGKYGDGTLDRGLSTESLRTHEIRMGGDASLVQTTYYRADTGYETWELQSDYPLTIKSNVTMSGASLVTLDGFVLNNPSFTGTIASAGNISVSGNITTSGANSTITSAKLSVGGATNETTVNIGGSTQIAYGNLTVRDGVIYGTVSDPSDSNIKDIISDSTLTVEQVANAPAVNFTWKKDAEKEIKEVNVGTLAQYWSVVLPEVVREREDGVLSMSYGNAAMVSSIVTAKEVVALKEQVAELQRQIEELKNK